MEAQGSFFLSNVISVHASENRFISLRTTNGRLYELDSENTNQFAKWLRLFEVFCSCVKDIKKN